MQISTRISLCCLDRGVAFWLLELGTMSIKMENRSSKDLNTLFELKHYKIVFEWPKMIANTTRSKVLYLRVTGVLGSQISLQCPLALQYHQPFSMTVRFNCEQVTTTGHHITPNDFEKCMGSKVAHKFASNVTVSEISIRFTLRTAILYI